MAGYPLAERIVAACEHSPPASADRDPRCFSDLEDERLHVSLLELWRAGILEADWDDDHDETEWQLSQFGAELCERGLARLYLNALEGEFEATAFLEASPSTLIDPEAIR